MPTKILPSADYLRECFVYDPETGALNWRPRPRDHFATTRAYSVWNSRYAEATAGLIHKSRAYLTVRIKRQHYKTHRIIFKMMTGEEPPATLDHRDIDPLNNQWINIRPATPAQQNYNQRAYSASGRRGVYPVPPLNKRWYAKIIIDGKRHYLGAFDTIDEAAAAYDAAARKYHGEFYRG